jgi:hypothetical protein
LVISTRGHFDPISRRLKTRHHETDYAFNNNIILNYKKKIYAHSQGIIFGQLGSSNIINPILVANLWERGSFPGNFILNLD